MKVIRINGGRVVATRSDRGWYANAQRRLPVVGVVRWGDCDVWIGPHSTFAFAWFATLAEVRRWAHQTLG